MFENSVLKFISHLTFVLRFMQIKWFNTISPQGSRRCWSAGRNDTSVDIKKKKRFVKFTNLSFYIKRVDLLPHSAKGARVWGLRCPKGFLVLFCLQKRTTLINHSDWQNEIQIFISLNWLDDARIDCTVEINCNKFVRKHSQSVHKI